MAEESQPSLPKIMHPLWMPRGSIRALLTLIILGSVGFLMYCDRLVHPDLRDALLMVLGYYFAMRRTKTEGAVSGERCPLWLPGGSIRILILAAFIAMTYLLFKENRLLGNPQLPLLVLGWGFLGGYYLKWILQRWQESLSEKFFVRFLGHTKAFIAIAVTLAYCLAFVLGRDALVAAHPYSSKVFLAVVGFYFGSR